MVIQQENNKIILPKIYSQWPKGEDGVKATQEAWQKGEFFNEEKTIKIYNHLKYGYIKVFLGDDGCIYGYPIKTHYESNLIQSIADFSDFDLIELCKLLRKNYSIFNFVIRDYSDSALGYAERFWLEKFKILPLKIESFSDFNYSLCWTLLFKNNKEKLKLQISIIAPFYKIEFLGNRNFDAKIIEQIKSILIKNNYILLTNRQLGLKVEGIELENCKENINVSKCLFEEH